MGGLFSGASKARSCCGMDSIKYFDDRIYPRVFPAPSVNKKKMESLGASDEDKRTTMRMIKSGLSELNISTVAIAPKNNLLDKYVIFSHGNGSDIELNYQWQKYFCDRFGVHIISYDYPSYGFTDGRANESKCVECLSAVVSFVESFVKRENIILMGHSLGTGVVIDYVSQQKWRNPIILVAPYKSIPRVILDSSFADCLIKNYKLGSIYKINQIICPVKIIHGEADTLILVSHGKEIYDKLVDKSLRPVWVKDAGHNDILEMLPERDIMEVLAYGGAAAPITSAM
ncbi:MAG: putative alpha/beta hydrolase [Hyperionvirus sp.]|uniref:Putative alpha/beta hydrolase n=1 Tax=Hyperionvirus sp. TaxID=2487770 RepID=A0A3G5A984_9VIRU|nr:MAG: putative alpha/beta hydrolase [Hyperionvirus sp.]